MNPELSIDPEFEAFCPPLSDEEFTKLHTSVMYYGCIDPIRTWNGTIIDGHNRYKICQKFNRPFTTKEVADLHTREDVFIWMYNNQMARRNLTDFQRVEFALKVKPHLEAKARERQLEHLRRREMGKSLVGQNSAQRGDVEKSTIYETGRTAETLAKKAGVSHDTVKRVEKILKEADPETVEKARSGEISINKAFQTVKSKKEPKPAEKPKTQTQAEKDQAFIDEAMADGPTLEELVDELERENDQLNKKIESLTKDDKDAEIVRLQESNAMLKRQIDTLTETKGQAEKSARYATSKLLEIGDMVGDRDFSTIVETVRKALGK